MAGFTSHRLPVVAMGLLPHIYQREGRSLGDPNRSCLVARSYSTYVAMLIWIAAEFFQR